MAALLIARIVFTVFLVAQTTASPEASPVARDPVFVGAGDIANCNHDNDEATAELLDDIEGTVFTLGDNAYSDGTPEQFAECYDPTWGRHKDRTWPAPGNHDYETDGAAGYFGYFGEAAGDPATGYYSYDLGAWHIIVLNSNCDDVGGCDEGSPQLDWLKEDLAEHESECTLAYWHHARFSSGDHGEEEDVQPLWATLADASADVVLAGHDHIYERFAPMNANGEPDEEGIRSFVVGTGGAGLYDLEHDAANSEVVENDSHGVLKLTLKDGSYDWEFIPVDGDDFTDSGSGDCH
jgi:acid phosphatase type 7